MSNTDILELKSIMLGAPLSTEAEALEASYEETFNTLDGLTNFVYACGGVKSAIEVLVINQSTR